MHQAQTYRLQHPPGPELGWGFSVAHGNGVMVHRAALSLPAAR